MHQKINRDILNLLPLCFVQTARFALVKFGGGVVQMSGSIAGDTFARNRYGNYCRARTKPTNPNTSRQQKIRGIIATLTSRWAQTLSAAQRAAWKLYGDSVSMKNRLGESVFLTGFNHYIRSNVWPLDLGQSPYDDGPTVFELPEQDGTITVAASEGAQQVTVTFDDGADWCSEDDAGLMILEGSPQNPQRNFFAGPWKGRSAKMGQAAVPITSPQDYASIHVITELQRLWVRFRIIRADGRLSEPFRGDCFVGA